MKKIENIILFENECNSLDFKLIQYEKPMYSKFLKDLISLANARSKDDKYIIIGVKHYPNGKRDLLGIKDDFIDDATYQQLVHENIQPELQFEYLPFELEGNLFGVFRIIDCSNPPYMMKKAFGKLRKGDSFIRKGTHQPTLDREDLDIIFEDRLAKGNFNGNIELFFVRELQKVINVQIINCDSLPSLKAEQKIKNIISKKEKELSRRPEGLKNILDRDKFLIAGMNNSYEDRSLTTLRKNLENVKKDYVKHDNHHLFEIEAFKFNFTILNKGDKYLEDTSIEVSISNKDIMIADTIYTKPSSQSPFSTLQTLIVNNEAMFYPSVTEGKNEYVIVENVGDLKHNIKQLAFKEPLRIVILPTAVANKISIKIKIFAKNLIKPIEEELIIKVIRY